MELFWFTFQRQLIAEKGSVQLMLVQLHIKQYLRFIYFIVVMMPLLVDIILPVLLSERCARLCCGQCRRPECGGPGRAAAAQRAV